ncbi:MAG: hypothetical protein Q9162_005961 [Coniocarpon cinnabarinum]
MADSGSKVPTVVGVLTVELILSLVAVGARLYTRTVVKRVAGWDDALLVLGLVLIIGFSIGMFVCVGDGYGRHKERYSSQEYIQIIKTELIAQTFVVLAFVPTKCAVGATMIRVFPGRVLHAILWFMMITVAIIFVLNAILDFVQCNPPHHMWDYTVPASCWNPLIYTRYSIFTGAWGALYDFVCVVVPWCAGACAIVKSVELQKLSSRTDYAYDTVGINMWSSSELCLICIAASIPTLRPLLRKIQGKSDNQYRETPHSHEFQTFGSKPNSHGRIAAARLPSRTDSEEALTLDHLAYVGSARA